MTPKRIQPGPGQESVWDYPRPPRVEDFSGHVQVVFNGVTIADTHRARRVLETSHPPAYYIPPQDIRMEYLEQSDAASFCEWKGLATHWSVTVGGNRFEAVAWSYPEPLSPFESIAGMLSFYPGRVECYVGDERAQPQPGGLYGGWVTSDLAGPIKGGPGTSGW